MYRQRSQRSLESRDPKAVCDNVRDGIRGSLVGLEIGETNKERLRGGLSCKRRGARSSRQIETRKSLR